MQATLHKKSGGMHHVKKSGGMKLMKKTGGMATTKKTGGMATTKKTGGMKKIGGMNMTKKSGGNCGMPLATSGGMRRKTVKGGMYHSKKHGGSRKVIGGGENEVIIDGNKYHITVNRGSVTVKAMEPESFEATKVPVLDKDGFPVPPADAADDGGHLDLEDLDTNIEDQSLIIDTLTEQGNKSQEGNELMNIRDPQFQDDEGAKKKEDLSIDKNKSSFGSQEGQKDYTMTDYSKEEKEEEGEGEGDPFTDAPSETLETLINNIKKGDFDKQKIIDGYNNLTTPEDQYGLIEYIENSDLAGKNTILDEIDPRDGLSAMGIYNEAGKKKGGKTLKKGSKPVKKHGGSVKKAFNKLFKRGGNKALPKKGGKK